MTRILIDTHIFLWAITNDRRLSHESRLAFESAGNELVLSVVSMWEISIKRSLGKLPLPEPAREFLEAEISSNRLTVLELNLRHIAELDRLPRLHRDPFDRVLVAQARAEGIALLSQDTDILQYNIR
ncbi:MAG: type II toxin-antitoxin system VapC family toxin [Bryobacteraceae bacterium]|nr:type II toxin-antitoxin system VapC family toxin [Bryobacteraceae bacterium]